MRDALGQLRNPEIFIQTDELGTVLGTVGLYAKDPTWDMDCFIHLMDGGNWEDLSRSRPEDNLQSREDGG